MEVQISGHTSKVGVGAPGLNKGHGRVLAYCLQYPLLIAYTHHREKRWWRLTAASGRSRERQRGIMKEHQKQERWRELHGDELRVWQRLPKGT